MSNIGFGEFLLERGYISREDYLAATEYMKANNRSLEELAIERKMLAPEHIRMLHSRMKQTGLSLGETSIKCGYFTETQWTDLLIAHSQTQIHLGSALIRCRRITQPKFDEAMLAYRAESREDDTVSAGKWLTGRPERVIMEPFFEAVNGIMHDLGAPQVAATGLREMGGEVPPNTFTFLQKLTGVRPCQLGLIIETPVLGLLAPILLQGAGGADGEEALDAAVEFLGMAAGRVSSCLNRAGIKNDVDPPRILHPGEYSPMKESGIILTVRCGTWSIDLMARTMEY